MTKHKTLLSLLGASALALSLSACGNSVSPSNNKTAVFRTLDEIKESKKINIGVFSDKNPFGYVDEYGEYQGYDVYFARRIGDDLGIVSLLTLLKSGRCFSRQGP